MDALGFIVRALIGRTREIVHAMDDPVPEPARRRENEGAPSPSEIWFQPVDIRHQRSVHQERTVAVITGFSDDRGTQRVERSFGELLKLRKRGKAVLVARGEDDANVSRI